MQIKIAVYGGVLLLAWLWRDKIAAAIDPGRVTKTLDVVADVNSPYFGMTDAEIATLKGTPGDPARNPAVDPEMRRLIDRSNLLIAEDDAL